MSERAQTCSERPIEQYHKIHYTSEKCELLNVQILELFKTKKFNGKLQKIVYCDYLNPISHTNQPFDVKKQIFSSNTLSETNIANPKHGESQYTQIWCFSWCPGFLVKSISRLPQSKHKVTLHRGISSFPLLFYSAFLVLFFVVRRSTNM